MHKLGLVLLIATIVINIIAITMKNYTVAIVFSSIYIAYAISSMLTAVVMNPQKRARINPFGNATATEGGGSIFTSSIRPRIPKQDPHPNDPRPNMEPIDISLFPQTYRVNPVVPPVPGPQPTDGGSTRWSTGSYDTVGDPREWGLNDQVHDFKKFMASENIKGRSSFNDRESLNGQVNAFFDTTRSVSSPGFVRDPSRLKGE